MNHVAHNAFPVGRWTLRTNDFNDSRKVKTSSEGTDGLKGRVGCHQFEPSSEVAAVSARTNQPGTRLSDKHLVALGASAALGSLLSLNPKLLS